MDADAFKEKFGCTQEEYADRMARKLRGALAGKEDSQDAVRLEVAIAQLREQLDRHFRQSVSEGIVKDWTLVISKNGDCQLKVVSVKEYVDLFRKRGFDVTEAP